MALCPGRSVGTGNGQLSRQVYSTPCSVFTFRRLLRRYNPNRDRNDASVRGSAFQDSDLQGGSLRLSLNISRPLTDLPSVIPFIKAISSEMSINLKFLWSPLKCRAVSYIRKISVVSIIATFFVCAGFLANRTYATYFKAFVRGM